MIKDHSTRFIRFFLTNDMTNDYKPQKCQNCGKVFLASRYDTYSTYSNGSFSGFITLCQECGNKAVIEGRANRLTF